MQVPPEQHSPLSLTPEQRAAWLRRAHKLNAEEKFVDFVKLMWPVNHSEQADPLVFGWALEAICEHLEAVHRGQIQKLLINCPPGFAKSILTTQMFPAWEWGPRNQPYLNYITATHTFNLACDHNRKARNYIESELYQELWGDRFTLEGDANAKQRFANDKGGMKLAIGTEGSLTGERAHRVMVDDPHTVADADSPVTMATQCRWYFETASSRNKNPARACHVIIMQRLNIQDLAGRILADANALGFELLCIDMEFDPEHPFARKRRSRIGWRDPRQVRYEEALKPWEAAQKVLGDYTLSPAVRAEAAKVQKPEGGEIAFPERFSREEIDNQRAQWALDRGSYVQQAQHQQNPIPEKGGMFEKGKVTIVSLGDVPMTTAPFARGWDFAGSETDKSPWTVGALGRFIQGKIYVYDILRRRVDSDALDNLLRETADSDDVGWGNVVQDFPQDPAQAGKYQARHISQTVLQGHDFAYSPEGRLDKVQRARPFAAQWNAGNVIFVEGPWTVEAEAEIVAFPGGLFKDQVDALVRMYNRLLMRRKQKLPGAGMSVAQEATDENDGVTL